MIFDAHMSVEVLESAREMARLRFGYGRWDAPYWFIGPEEGMDAAEDPKTRLNAWRVLGSTELCDCREFHNLIGQSAYFAAKPKPVKVWKAMITVLLNCKGDSAAEQQIADYQRDRWGRLAGEVCVAELSGLAANNMEEGKQQLRNLFTEPEIKKLRQDRVKTICDRIAT
ncbi:MAG: hypothetical protein WCB58_02250, partial [Acidobacteriaceae bacterium]